ncbi:MAG: hypothetical protein KJ587_08870 [Alphaproteobacteria bacterium]|nr:hypothetical protein [Alphaproteobacteria bacterium]
MIKGFKALVGGGKRDREARGAGAAAGGKRESAASESVVGRIGMKISVDPDTMLAKEQGQPS